MSKVRVEICGQIYSISGDGDSEYIIELARYVDYRMKEVAKQSREVSTAKLAIIGAINIAHDLFELKKQNKDKDDALLKQADMAIGELSSSLDKVLNAERKEPQTSTLLVKQDTP